MGRARSLSQFQREFPNEESCATFLAARRWPDGFVCPGCGSKHGWSLASRARLYECTDCRRQTSITAGTVLHRSKLPLQVWFWAAHLMATHSNGMSALQLAAQLGVTYKTAWLLAQKLRRSMIDPDRSLLEGVVEVDQTEIPFRTDDAFGKIIVARTTRRLLCTLSYGPTSDREPRCSPTATAPIRASPATATIHARSARWRATSPCHGFIASSR